MICIVLIVTVLAFSRAYNIAPTGKISASLQDAVARNKYLLGPIEAVSDVFELLMHFTANPLVNLLSEIDFRGALVVVERLPPSKEIIFNRGVSLFHYLARAELDS